MKKIFLISVTIIIVALMTMAGAGCTASAAATAPIAVEFIGSDFELSLPEKWDGGTKEEIDAVVENLKEAGRVQLADEVAASKKDLLFYGYNSEEAAQEGSVSNLIITGEFADFLSIEEYMELPYTNISELYIKAGYEFEIIEEDIVSIGNYDKTGRVIFEQTVEGIKTKVAQYIIKYKTDFWVLTFTTDIEKFDENVEAFDKTIETFKILD
ncbi:MAG: hypothetical protein JW983_08055 [Elusimicrobia bacterium]|nr:hypothetical protein [Elusimicrobiota bacterium]